MIEHPHDSHPLAVQWARARGERRSLALPTLDGGMWFVNGRPTVNAPAEHPYVLQQVARDGAVLQTKLLSTGTLPVALAEPEPTPEPPSAEAPSVVEAEPTVQPSVEPYSPPRSVPPREKRDFPVRTVVGGALLAGGAAVASSIALRRAELCTLPDANGDGFFDCGTGTTVAFWTGVGGAAAGAVIGAVGLGKEWRRAEASVGFGPSGVSGELRFVLR
ncbi:MAG: hypothetical protein AAF211_08680 [Myxococcota bacterium]